MDIVPIAAGIVLALTALALGGQVLSILRTQRIESISTISSDAALYAQGAEAARKRAAKGDKKESALGRKLHEAGIEMGTQSWVLMMSVIALVLVVLLYVSTHNPLIALLCLPVVYLVQNLYIGSAQRKRKSLLTAQLAKALPQVASGMRASFTPERAIRITAVNQESPLKDEFQRVAADAAYSTTLPEAITRMAVRTGNKHVKSLASAFAIQSRQGGDLAPTLDDIATNVMAELDAERERKSEIAAMKLTKWVVAAAPPLIAAFLFATDARYTDFYFGQPYGVAILVAAGTAEVAGLYISNRITRI